MHSIVAQEMEVLFKGASAHGQIFVSVDIIFCVLNTAIVCSEHGQRPQGTYSM
jgi:hypothetical protein